MEERQESADKEPFLAELKYSMFVSATGDSIDLCYLPASDLYLLRIIKFTEDRCRTLHLELTHDELRELSEFSAGVLRKHEQP